jgi:hypothetical protein
MRQFNARLEGIVRSPTDQSAAWLSCSSEDIPQPGQAVMAYKLEDHQPLRKVLFPIQLLKDGFVADAPPEPSWRIGDILNLWGPLGQGFNPPQVADKWLLASFDNPPQRLFSLIQTGLDRGAAISLCTEQLPTNLSPQVEWIQDITEALAWANYLALDLPLEAIPSLRTQLGLSPDGKIPAHAQVLIAQPIPCGFGACYACALKGKHGSFLTCTDGPVFELDQLEF